MNNQSSDKVFVNSQELIEIAKSIESKKDQIMNIYKTEVLPSLESSESCLSAAGLNYSELINVFNKVYNGIDSQISSMTNVLINKIAPNYDAIALSIKNSFNSEFTSQMNECIAKMNSNLVHAFTDSSSN